MEEVDEASLAAILTIHRIAEDVVAEFRGIPTEHIVPAIWHFYRKADVSRDIMASLDVVLRERGIYLNLPPMADISVMQAVSDGH